jgi:hypothetical protein
VVVRTNDGKRFAGRDAKAIVRRMKRDQWHIERVPKREYMEEVALRVSQTHQRMVRTDAEGFLLDLADAGLLEFEQQGVA